MFKFRVVIALSALLALVGLAAAPASAGSRSLFKSSGVSASTDWTQVDGTPLGGTNGNVHIGSLYAMESGSNLAYVSVYIDDFDCPAGMLPGGHGEETEGGCVYLASRQGWGEGLKFTFDRKLNTANLTGTVTLYGFDHNGEGTVAGNPGINVTWNGYGSLAKFSSNYRWSDAYGSYSDRYSGESRSATMSGTIGPMGFHPDRSGGSIGSYKQMSKSTSK